MRMKVRIVVAGEGFRRASCALEALPSLLPILGPARPIEAWIEVPTLLAGRREDFRGLVGLRRILCRAFKGFFGVDGVRLLSDCPRAGTLVVPSLALAGGGRAGIAAE